jgi:DNA primase
VRKNDDVDRVREASDIVRIVGEHVALKAKGREYVGLCPFHDDHKPSMNVVPSKGIFHCFVCGSGGDVFSFVQKFHKMDFREALEYLAEKANVKLTPWKPAGGGVGGGVGSEVVESGVSRSDLLNANAFAAEYFKLILSHATHGAVARGVLAKRGISTDMVAQFGLGASPDEWEGLVKMVRKKGIDERIFVEAGLIKRRDGGDGCFDALRNRLIFPIQDQIGRVIAFGGRKIKEEDEPKYLNSPETRLFNKSATLYGLNHAAKAIQQKHTAIITEGYTDTIACHQAGVTNAVATLGTALTREHAVMLRRMCDRVVLLFDGDEAGQRAADRAVPIFFAEPLDVRICALSRFSDAKDPDELLKREGGKEIFERALAGSIDLLEYRFARLRSRLEGAGVAALSRAIDEEIAQYVEWGLGEVAPVRQTLIVKQLAALAGVDEDTVRRAIPRGRGGPRRVPQAVGVMEAKPSGVDAASMDVPPADSLESTLARVRSLGLSAPEHLLGCVLVDGELWSALPHEHGHELIAPRAYGLSLMSRLAEVVDEIAMGGDSPGLSHVLDVVEDLDVKALATALHQRIEHETEASRERLRRHFNECVRQASRDLAMGAPSVRVANDEPTSEERELLAMIEVQRRAHAELGADRRKIPRPT